MSPFPVVSVGIVTWNSAADLPRCLAALAAQAGVTTELIVVDNDSSDGSARLARDLAPQASIIQNDQNRGFCGGHNQAIAASAGAYYLPLNPDVVMTPTYITELVAAVETGPQYGMAAGRLYQGTPETTPRRFDSTGLFIDRRRRQHLRGFEAPDQGQYDEPADVFGVDGAAPLYGRAMLEDIRIDGQYFDEAFHSHKEDVDLAWRARIFGWRCRYTPRAVAYHRRTFQPGKRQKIAAEVRLHAVKNRYLLLLKNESGAGWRRDGARILFYDLQILAYMLLFERSSLKAFPALRRNWSNALRWQKEIRARAKVPAQEQARWFVDPEQYEQKG